MKGFNVVLGQFFKCQQPLIIMLSPFGVLCVGCLARFVLGVQLLVFFRRDDWCIQYGLYIISGFLISATSEFLVVVPAVL